MAHLLSKFEKDRIDRFLVINGKPRFFGQKRPILKLNFSNFWNIKKFLDGVKRWSFLCLTLPLNTFCHNFNHFCDISSQNLKSRFFAVFWGLILTLDICKNWKKLLMTLRFGQKLPLILESKVIKSQSRPMSHLKMKIFFRPRGVNLTPPQAE